LLKTHGARGAEREGPFFYLSIMATNFKCIVFTLKHSSEELRTAVALKQWYDSDKQKCRYPAPSQMCSYDVMEIIKTSCSPHQSWPSFQTVEVTVGQVRHVVVDVCTIVYHVTCNAWCNHDY